VTDLDVFVVTALRAPAREGREVLAPSVLPQASESASWVLGLIRNSADREVNDQGVGRGGCSAQVAVSSLESHSGKRCSCLRAFASETGRCSAESRRRREQNFGVSVSLDRRVGHTVMAILSKRLR